MYTAKKIYYDNATGVVIWDPSYNQSTTVDFEHDYLTVLELNERVKSSIGLLVLDNGLFSQDFSECTGYRVNVVTKELEFSYPDPNVPEAPPVFLKPLTEQVEDLRTQLKTTNDTVDFLLGM